MSVVTLEQETLTVLTELTDEEINGIVGGGTDVKSGVNGSTKVKIDKGNVTVQNGQQVGTAVAIAFNGDAKANVDQNLTQKVYEGKKGGR